MKKFFLSLDEYLAGITFAFVLFLSFINVMSRYLINASIAFTYELTTNLFVLLTLLGASVAAKKKKHLGLALLTDYLPRKAQKVVEVINCALSSAFCILAVYLGARMAMQQFSRGQISAALRVPEWIYGTFLPIGMAFICVSFIISTYETLKSPDVTEPKGD